MTPLVSVVVRCHNSGAYLAEALASIWSQDLPPDEVVVIDDGSTDDTDSVLEAQRISGRRFSTIRRVPARGAAASFNDAVAATMGELIVVLDADDLMSPNYLRETARVMATGGIDVVSTPVCMFGLVTRCLPARRVTRRTLALENPVHSSAMFRRWVFDATGGRPVGVLPHDYGDDWAMWIAAYEMGAKFAVADGACLSYRRHQATLTSRVSRRDVLGTTWALHRLHPRTVGRRHVLWRAGYGIWRTAGRRVRSERSPRSAVEEVRRSTTPP